VELVDVDLSWPPDKIREFCENNVNWCLALPQEWSGADIEALYKRQLTVAQPYVGVISEIAADLRVSAATLMDIWRRFGSSVEVASALATNPAIPVALRQILLSHHEDVVREHAHFSIAVKPLADDTVFDIEAMQLETWRSMADAHKAALVVGASRSADLMAVAGIRARYPGASAREQFLRLAILKLGHDLARRAYPEVDALDLR